MTVREKPDERVEPGARRQPSVSVEREVHVSRAVEGPVSDIEPHVHSPAEQSARRTHHTGSARSQRRRRRLRLALVLGAIVLVVAPSVAVPERLTAFDLFTLASAVLVMKALSALVALSAVTWRLRRHASGLRRFLYFVGVWAMASGLGLAAADRYVLAGTLAFDAGVLVLFVLFLGDDRLRGERTPLAA